jgi:hypothetical protein
MVKMAVIFRVFHSASLLPFQLTTISPKNDERTSFCDIIPTPDRFDESVDTWWQSYKSFFRH